jgi:hypothetical protein
MRREKPFDLREREAAVPLALVQECDDGRLSQKPVVGINAQSGATVPGCSDSQT